MGLCPLVDGFGECVFAADGAQEIDLGRRQIERRRSHIDPVGSAGDDDVLQSNVRCAQHVRHRLLDVCQVDSEPDGQIGLGVHVDTQDSQASLGESASQIDGSGRLADATFLVCYRDDICHRGFTSLERFRGGQPARATFRCHWRAKRRRPRNAVDFHVMLPHDLGPAFPAYPQNHQVVHRFCGYRGAVAHYSNGPCA